MTTEFVRLLLLIQVASTLYMTGVIWIVQVVHYPLFERVGESVFSNYEQRHTSSVTWVVAPPMLIEGASTALLLCFAPHGNSTWSLWVGFALLLVIWLSTAFVQVPCHQALANAFDAAVHRRLVSTNWIRTVAWTARSALVLWILWSLAR
jgi:hypothetical protein